MYAAKVLADSLSCGVRLTTLQVTFPRIVLAEFNTHRMLSRNSASSRAIPVEKRIAEVEANPFVPEAFGANQRGMQAGGELDYVGQAMSRAAWNEAKRSAVKFAGVLAEAGVHKQWANRLLEPFVWHTVIVTATEWDNFFALRLSPLSQPEIRRAAELMKAAMDDSKPLPLDVGDWHLPLIDLVHDDIGLSLNEWIKCSVARCARVSYLTHEGKRDVAADIALHDRLLRDGHMSPFEHVARVGDESEDTPWTHVPTFVGNLRWPWVQYRKTLPGEAVFGAGK